VFAVNVQIALTDIPSPEHGPTQVVPTSHRSGSRPPAQDPVFDGHGPLSILARAGDAYLQDSQVWHRGAPNLSERTRYLYQICFGRRMIAQRLYPYLNYRAPDQVMDGAGERLLRVLGKHRVGSWG
jgi:ectoine hydroxylase-related dioxygenase (phytanoyl-CoA dioxygenase family)